MGKASRQRAVRRAHDLIAKTAIARLDANRLTSAQRMLEANAGRILDGVVGQQLGPETLAAIRQRATDLLGSLGFGEYDVRVDEELKLRVTPGRALCGIAIAAATRDLHRQGRL